MRRYRVVKLDGTEIANFRRLADVADFIGYSYNHTVCMQNGNVPYPKGYDKRIVAYDDGKPTPSSTKEYFQKYRNRNRDKFNAYRRLRRLEDKENARTKDECSTKSK
ncbi:MAG: hypothetical protein KBT03_09265 [Bacteroidales bacterium]|nr:hypothetical protein [Candidatus Scybalousia scybalohippi]